MKTSTLTLIYRDCSNCGQMTVTSDWQTIVAVIAVAHSPIGAWKFP